MTDTTSAMREALEKARDALKAAEPYIEVHKRDLNLKSTDRVMQTDAAISEALIAIEAALTAPAQADIHATTDILTDAEIAEIQARHDQGWAKSTNENTCYNWVSEPFAAQMSCDRAVLLRHIKAHSPTPPRLHEDDEIYPGANDIIARYRKGVFDPVLLERRAIGILVNEIAHWRQHATRLPTPPRVDELVPDKAGWLTLKVERALYVHEGINTILCDRLPSPITLVVKLAAP